MGVVLIGLCSEIGLAHPVEGVYWMLGEGDGKLKAYVEKGELKVQVIAIKPKSEHMLDKKNKDVAKRKQRVLGMHVMQGFRWNEGETHWEGGTIYDPTDGATYDAFIWQDEVGNLRVRGYRLIGWFGRTETFERVSGRSPTRAQKGEPRLVYLK